MTEYRLSKDAEQDVIDIYLYTVENFGARQADRYVDELEERFKVIASSPKLGRRYDEVKAGVRRLAYESHSIYYTVGSHGIFVLRILHQRMDPGRHLI
ncbi:type II toxin-antitoxin system RelE/ParE family toxin [Dinoroseobacter sp. S76]|uniref:type II toxin-antitoxin system RelE/ParE family toxin n=1 Tax=Dinoroseobacter sp. S76 TaxID=3415124 RepID=UPI003C7A4496